MALLALLSAGLLSIPSFAWAGDSVLCFRRVPTIIGTENDERIPGTSGRDVIFGGGGMDLILGREGKDVICGGAGRDSLRGGPGGESNWTH